MDENGNPLITEAFVGLRASRVYYPALDMGGTHGKGVTGSVQWIR